MTEEEITENDRLIFASENECFDFLFDVSEDNYTEKDGVTVELI